MKLIFQRYSFVRALRSDKGLTFEIRPSLATCFIQKFDVSLPHRRGTRTKKKISSCLSSPKINKINTYWQNKCGEKHNENGEVYIKMLD